MSESAVQSRFDSLAADARERFALRTGGKTKITVRVGHCGLAVGASDVLAEIRERYEDIAAIIVSGCDGACFTAPSIKVESETGGTEEFGPVSIDTIANLDRYLSPQAVGETPTERPIHDDADLIRFLQGQHRITLDGCGALDAESIDHYIAIGGYGALALALQSDQSQLIETIKDSRLRGRGGAYFPVGLKWEGARNTPADHRVVVVNCEEGEPGLFKDRHLMEGVPHRVVEGALVAAYAAGATELIFYINAEAELSAERMAVAIDQAGDAGLIGEGILGSGFGVTAEIRRGAGGYVCGDETTLLNTLEGDRREPRLKPPFPTESGLWGQPTVINNAETLASIPYILLNGSDQFASIGDGQDTGTKIMNLSGSVRRPGLVEVPIGTTLRQIIFEIGGGMLEGKTLKTIGLGGPSSGVFPTSMLDTPIRPGFIHESGVMLGAGGIIAVDDSMSVRDVVRSLAQYNASESCGKCTPCREGTPRMVRMLDDLASGEASGPSADDLEKLARLVNEASLCGLGQAAGNPILSGLHFFRDELVTSKS